MSQADSTFLVTKKKIQSIAQVERGTHMDTRGWENYGFCIRCYREHRLLKISEKNWRSSPKCFASVGTDRNIPSRLHLMTCALHASGWLNISRGNMMVVMDGLQLPVKAQEVALLQSFVMIMADLEPFWLFSSSSRSEVGK